MNAIIPTLILSTLTISLVISCNNFTEPDEDETSFYKFMQSLEDLTFKTSCSNLPVEDFNGTIWKYREELYCKYMDRLNDCKCKDDENDFEICLLQTRNEMKADVDEFQSKIAECNENFELLVPNWCGNENTHLV